MSPSILYVIPLARACLGGVPEAPPTWCVDIEPFYDVNCARCHNGTDAATASDLSGYARWSDPETFQSIYGYIQAGAMPKDTQGELESGSLYLLQRWQEGGMVECDTP